MAASSHRDRIFVWQAMSETFFLFRSDLIRKDAAFAIDIKISMRYEWVPMKILIPTPPC